MRTLTAQQTATLTAAPGYATWGRVRILRGATWWDVTNLYGSDFLDHVTISEQMDAPVAQATVRLRREVSGLSCAQFITSSPINLVGDIYDPLVRPGRTFLVEGAVTPLGSAPAAGDWMELFRGRIDDPDAGGDEVTFTGRDASGLLQDTFIETERTYGSGPGVAIETVLQSILTDNGMGTFSLYTPVVPGWHLGPFIQRGEPIHDALQKLARELGWEVRWKWSNASAAYVLTFWSPDRAATAPSWTFGPSSYRSITRVATSIEDVRNAVEIVYSDRADLDAAGNPKRKTVVRTDAASITANGRRFMRVAEEAASHINTQAEAQRMADAALADLKDTPLGVELDVGLHPGLELGDLVRITGNAVTFSADQTAAVRQITHTITAEGGRTTLVLRGKPSTSIRAWLEMEQRPGIAPASPFTGPAAPTGLTYAETPLGFAVRFSPPTSGAPAAAYELHVSLTSGFTPTEATRRVVGALTEMSVTNLGSGSTHYVKIVPRDAKGNRGTASAELAVVPRYVEPRTLQPVVAYGALPLNGDWEATNAPSAPPDAWTMTLGTWGVDALVTTDSYTGGSALLVKATAATKLIEGGLFVSRPGDRYRFDCYAKGGSGGAGGAPSRLTYMRVVFYSGPTTSISTTDIVLTNDTGTWNRTAAELTAPANTKYARISIYGTSTMDRDTYIDSVAATPLIAQEALRYVDVAGEPLFENSFTHNTDGLGSVAFYRDSGGRVHLSGACERSSAPSPGATIFTLPTGYRPGASEPFVVATDGGVGRVTIKSTGAVEYTSGSVGWFGLNGVSFRAT